MVRQRRPMGTVRASNLRLKKGRNSFWFYVHSFAALTFDPCYLSSYPVIAPPSYIKSSTHPSSFLVDHTQYISICNIMDVYPLLLQCVFASTSRRFHGPFQPMGQQRRDQLLALIFGMMHTCSYRMRTDGDEGWSEARLK